jgi:hypothetical protein
MYSTTVEGLVALNEWLQKEVRSARMALFLQTFSVGAKALPSRVNKHVLVAACAENSRTCTCLSADSVGLLPMFVPLAAGLQPLRFEPLLVHRESA